MRLELAVGNIVDLRGKPVLEEDEDGQGDEEIAEGKLEFFFHDQTYPLNYGPIGQWKSFFFPAPALLSWYKSFIFLQSTDWSP
jgi:hypothetical protein